MLEAKGLVKKYAVRNAKQRKEVLTAANGVDLRIEPGQTVGLVGESGSGKSTLGRLLAGLDRPDAGQVLFEGKPLQSLTKEERKNFRRSVQMIFQNPMNSLNPRWTVRAILQEPFRLNPEAGKGNAAELKRLLEEVRLPEAFLTRHPHELSGGERQRVCIARALALRPKIVICDEAVSSLDVLVRAEILNLLVALQEQHGIGYLFISHDLSVIRHVSDQIAVMRKGLILERGASHLILDNPQEPYTKELIAASSSNL